MMDQAFYAPQATLEAWLFGALFDLSALDVLNVAERWAVVLIGRCIDVRPFLMPLGFLRVLCAQHPEALLRSVQGPSSTCDQLRWLYVLNMI